MEQPVHRQKAASIFEASESHVKPKGSSFDKITDLTVELET